MVRPGARHHYKQGIAIIKRPLGKRYRKIDQSPRSGSSDQHPSGAAFHLLKRKGFDFTLRKPGKSVKNNTKNKL